MLVDEIPLIQQDQSPGLYSDNKGVLLERTSVIHKSSQRLGLREPENVKGAWGRNW